MVNFGDLFVEVDLSPGKYNPNLNVIRKNAPSVSLGPKTTKHVGSMKNYMESFIRTILPNSETNYVNWKGNALG